MWPVRIVTFLYDLSCWERCKLLRLGFWLPDSKLSQCQVHPESPHVWQGYWFSLCKHVQTTHLSWADVRGGVQRATSQSTGTASIYSPWALQVCWTAKDLSNANVNALRRKTLFHIPLLFFSISVLFFCSCTPFDVLFLSFCPILLEVSLKIDCGRLRYLKLLCHFQTLHPLWSKQIHRDTGPCKSW